MNLPKISGCTGLLARRLLAVGTISVLTTSCGPGAASDPQAAKGWFTNCRGPDFARFGAQGPGPNRPVFKITNELIVAVDGRYHPLASRLEHPVRACNKISDIPAHDFLEFVIQGEWSDAYRPDDVPTVGGQKQFRPDVVWARIEPERPSNLPLDEQRKVEETAKKFEREESIGTREIGGLVCVVSKYRFLNSTPFCTGHRSPNDNDLIKITLKLNTPNTPFVLIQADYTSSRFGGLVVTWQA